MRTVILAPNLERLPPEEHAAFVHEVALHVCPSRA